MKASDDHNSEKTCISFVEVTKQFPLHFWKKKTALEDVSFFIPSGKVYGLLGANGSGKSTIFKLILGFIRPSIGEISVFQYRPGSVQARNCIGYLPETARLPKFMTGEQLLGYFGRLQGLDRSTLAGRIDEVFEMVDLNDARRERIAGYSKGMTQRLSIAQALIQVPKILILDEPMSGLDPLGRKKMKFLIQRLRQENPSLTILMSTHTLEDAVALCQTLVLLRRGKLIHMGPPDAFLQKDKNELDPRLENLLFSEAKVAS